MTYKARPRWVRRLRMAWGVLTQPTLLLDQPMFLLDERRRRAKVEQEFRILTGLEWSRREQPIRDRVEKFDDLKRKLVALLVQYKHDDAHNHVERFELLLVDVELALTRAGGTPPGPIPEPQPATS